MALIPCSNCSKTMSSNAPMCPHCGTVASGQNPAQSQSLVSAQPRSVANFQSGNVGIKKRDILTICLLTFVTMGLYPIYWMVQTKEEINGLGADIPTAWLIIIPLVNFYWAFKYAEGFAKYVAQDNNHVGWFLMYIFLGPVFFIMVQLKLNKLAA